MGCKPHQWRTPKPGDSRLICETCGRELDRVSEVTQNIRTSIMISIEARRGPEDVKAFRDFFAAGYEPMVHHEVPKHPGFPTREERMKVIEERRKVINAEADPIS